MFQEHRVRFFGAPVQTRAVIEQDALHVQHRVGRAAAPLPGVPRRGRQAVLAVLRVVLAAVLEHAARSAHGLQPRTRPKTLAALVARFPKLAARFPKPAHENLRSKTAAVLKQIRAHFLAAAAAAEAANKAALVARRSARSTHGHGVRISQKIRRNPSGYLRCVHKTVIHTNAVVPGVT